METEGTGDVHKQQAHILIVDDNLINRKTLARAMENAGHRVSTAENGSQAIAVLQSEVNGPENETRSSSVDVILLDVLMPEMDGYQVLQMVKANSLWQHIPVIMISALDEMDSVVQCIELGATDYLHKPFKLPLLQARLNSSLAAKRLRDLELEYLEQVGRIASAAEAVEAAAYDPKSLDEVAKRPDALGKLANTFQRMAQEVHLREQRLVQQLRQMQLDVDEMKKALNEPASNYLPMDRIAALLAEAELPEQTWGTVLSADISGFTPLTEALTRQLGRERGAEELTRLLNQVYTVLIDTIHKYHGSVISFSGDAITCWFDGDNGLEALTSGLALQDVMRAFNNVTAPSGTVFSLGIKVAAAAGPIHRYLVGNPDIQLIEVMAGKTLDNLADTEKHARRGEVLAHASVVERLGARLDLGRVEQLDGSSCFVVKGVTPPAPERPWPEVPPHALADAKCQRWLLPEVYERLQATGKQYLAEFHPVAAFFLQFTGLNYDADPQAGARLDAFITQTQAVLRQHCGSLIQLTTGDKGSYLYAVFGAPSADPKSSLHAVRAALDIQHLLREFPFIHTLSIGISHGQMRVGAYGGDTRRTYGSLGEHANLAARLMQHAKGGILCSKFVVQATQNLIVFQALGTIQVKGHNEPLEIYRPIAEKHHLERRKTALVGRQAEQALFHTMLTFLQKGCGGVLWITGDPGTGKSYLLEAFEQNALQSGKIDIYHTQDIQTVLGNIIEEPALVLVDDVQDQDPQIIEQLINLPRLQKPQPDPIGHPGLAALVVLAGRLPTEGIVQPDRVVSCKEIALGKFEDDFTAGETLPDLIQMELCPLSPFESVKFTESILGVDALPEAVEALVSHLGGLPFYIEKILDHLLNNEQIRLENRQCVIPADSILNSLARFDRGEHSANRLTMLPAAVLPATVQSMLKNQLEILSPDEQMGLRLASALGREFTRDTFFSLLRMVEPTSSTGIDPNVVLEGLVNHGMLICRLVEPLHLGPICSFANGLIWSVAYETMLFVHRRALHRKIAEWFETEQTPGLTMNYRDIAEHWRRAEEMGKAIDYLEKAALQAQQAGDLDAARELLRETLALSSASAVLSQDFRQGNERE